MRVSAAEKLNELKALDARRLLGTLKSLKHTQPTIPFVIPTFSPGLIPMVSPVSSAFDNAAGNTSATGNTSVADFPSFASWAQYVSSHTNRSLAGSVLPSQIFTTEESRLAAHNWGIILSDHASHQVSQAHNLTSDLVHPDYDVRALSGKEAMDYAQAHMPVSAGLLDLLQSQGLNLHGVRIAACLILEGSVTTNG